MMIVNVYGFNSLHACKLCIFFLSADFLFKINFLKNIFQEYYQSVNFLPIELLCSPSQVLKIIHVLLLTVMGSALTVAQ